jgi:hypothetical protein
MLRRSIPNAGMAFFLLLCATPAMGQKLHTNHRWEECAIVIDPSLSREAWRQFVREAGIVIYFRPLASAKPLGRRNFEVALLQSATRIDDADPAWNDTFSHADSTHWLFEGDALPIPGLMVRAGVTDRIDVGAYYTKAIGANYHIAGGQVQYALVNDTERKFSAAGRLSAVRLFGPEDLNAGVYGLDFVVSKALSIVEPYAGVSGYLSRGKETTTKVDLDDETEFGAQAMLGVSARISVLRLGAEFTVAKKPVTSIKLAVGL